MSERTPGRDGAVDALVQAARELFVEQGPASVSLRDVARRAGVNHGLIHHYIGGREDLLRLVFTRATEQARRRVDGAGSPLEAMQWMRRSSAGSDEYTRLLAWALLERRDPAEFHGRSAAMDAVAGAGGAADDDQRHVRVALAMAMVQTLGWKLFGDYVKVALGFADDDPVGEEIDEMIDRIVADARTESRR